MYRNRNIHHGQDTQCISFNKKKLSVSREADKLKETQNRSENDTNNTIINKDIETFVITVFYMSKKLQEKLSMFLSIEQKLRQRLRRCKNESNQTSSDENYNI